MKKIQLFYISLLGLFFLNACSDEVPPFPAVDAVNGIPFEMVSVVGGNFVMGSPLAETYRGDDETQHPVILSSYQIGKYEVTQAQWKAVMGGENPSNFKGDNLPVENVSWDDIQLFIQKLNTLTGKNYRLPTEAEWEYAARGGNQSKGYLYSGSNNLDEVAWYYDNSGGKTHAVGAKRPNELGIYDMTGNVREWCSDWYNSAYPTTVQTDPTGPATGTDRVLRGGSWNKELPYCRSADRDQQSPSDRWYFSFGFRLVLSEKNTPTFEMIPVAGGTFTMGSPTTEADRGSDETQHPVTLSSYQIGKYEVTQAQWKAVMGGENLSQFKGDNLPVEKVSWDDVQLFIQKLNTLTGKNYRLPTEAEWEYAARGGSQSKGYLYSGSNNLDEVAWYDSNSGGKTHAVGAKCPNELGIYDMTGNVYEWCSDWYNSAYPTTVQTDPTGPATGAGRVGRGGSWDDFAQYCRSAFRYNGYPYDRFINLGFRLVLSEKNTPPPSLPPFEMLPVAGGTFTMGSPTTETYRDDNETQHPVTLSSYQIGKYEVTQAEWKAVMGGANPSNFKGDNLPVEQVSWDDIQLFIQKLNTLTGKNYRLPTEAEWEYAARGGSQSKGYLVCSGSNNLDEVAWHGSNSGNRTHVVGTKRPNELGIYDMTGNVSEWCSDWYNSAYPTTLQTDPTGPATGANRVARGGSWNGIWSGNARYCRSAYRDFYDPHHRDSYLGFRLVLSEKNTPPPPSLPPLEMLPVAGGTFTMGSPTTEANRYDDETQHPVTLSSYQIGKYEVTQAEWKAVMGGENPSSFKGDNLPVEQVSWDDIQIFIQKLNTLTGKNYRLPTEAEWEYAARGGSQSKGYLVYSGSNNLDEVAWYYDNSGGKTHAVGEKRPNELGIYDMTGNVLEWCSDWYNSAYPITHQTDPTGPATGTSRVGRGGSWNYNVRSCRSASRGGNSPSDGHILLGFRLVLRP